MDRNKNKFKLVRVQEGSNKCLLLHYSLANGGAVGYQLGISCEALGDVASALWRCAFFMFCLLGCMRTH